MKIQGQTADINTPTGVMRTYMHRPLGDKQYPTILFYSEIFQQTDPIASAARIIASHGHRCYSTKMEARCAKNQC